MNNTCTKGALYHIVTSGYHDSGFRTLMVVSRLCYTAILWHILPSVHYNEYLYIYDISHVWILSHILKCRPQNAGLYIQGLMR